MYRLLFAYCLLLWSFFSWAQGLRQLHIQTTDGKLPTCDILETPEGMNGQAITNNDFVTGSAVMLLDGQKVYDSGQWDGDKGGIRIRIRGNTSAVSSFCGYKLKLSKKADIAGFGYKEKNWNLLAVRPDKTMNNILGRTIANLVGMKFQPRYEYIELYINSDYRGLYMISDPIERGANRVNIGETGAIVENDNYWWKPGTTYFKTPYQDSDLGYTFKYPEDEDMSDDFIQSMSSYIADFEQNLFFGEEIDDYIDVPSMAAWILGHDILGNMDTAGSNMYLHINESPGDSLPFSQMHAGPMWDFDAAMMLEDKLSLHHRRSLMYFPTLFLHNGFREHYATLWRNIRSRICPLVKEMCDSLSRQYGCELDSAIARSALCQKKEYIPADTTCQRILSYMEHRVEWLDNFIMHIHPLNMQNEDGGCAVYSLNGTYLGDVNNLRAFYNRHHHTGMYIYRNKRRQGIVRRR